MVIGGTEIIMGVKINENDHREYLDIVSELQDEIVNVIEKLGHGFIIASSNPIDKDELQ